MDFVFNRTKTLAVMQQRIVLLRILAVPTSLLQAYADRIALQGRSQWRRIRKTFWIGAKRKTSRSEIRPVGEENSR